VFSLVTTSSVVAFEGVSPGGGGRAADNLGILFDLFLSES